MTLKDCENQLLPIIRHPRFKEISKNDRMEELSVSLSKKFNEVLQKPSSNPLFMKSLNEVDEETEKLVEEYKRLFIEILYSRCG